MPQVAIHLRKTRYFVLVEITLFPGRSPEAKRGLYQGIVEHFVALGINGNDLGFKVSV